MNKILSEDFKQEIEKDRKITLLSDYQSMRKKIDCQCNKCGFKWKAIARSTRLSSQEFLKRVKEIHPDIEVIGKFSTTREKIKLKCNKCGYIWNGRANLLLFNHCGCPRCKESKGKKRISNWLEKNEYSFLRQYKFDECKDKKPLSFDFFLPELNICIEYDGIQHYFPYKYFKGEEKLQYTQYHDNIKNLFCENNNIKLLRISYLEYNEIEDILQKYLKGGDAE